MEKKFNLSSLSKAQIAAYNWLKEHGQPETALQAVPSNTLLNWKRDLAAEFSKRTAKESADRARETETLATNSGHVIFNTDIGKRAAMKLNERLELSPDSNMSATVRSVDLHSGRVAKTAIKIIDKARMKEGKSADSSTKLWNDLGDMVGDKIDPVIVKRGGHYVDHYCGSNLSKGKSFTGGKAIVEGDNLITEPTKAQLEKANRIVMFYHSITKSDE